MVSDLQTWLSGLQHTIPQCPASTLFACISFYRQTQQYWLTHSTSLSQVKAATGDDPESHSRQSEMTQLDRPYITITSAPQLWDFLETAHCTLYTITRTLWHTYSLPLRC